MILTNLKSIRSQIIEHLSMPLFRNGYALVSSAALTSGFGVLYWVVAARQYSQEVVGINSALITMMIFIASIAQLDMAYAINRFLPKAGSKTIQFILYTYGFTTILALIVSTAFVLGSQLWSPTLHQFFQTHPETRWWFIAGSVTWCVFALQDSVMTGLRQATWVPLENFIFSVGKLGLLLFFATRLATVGVFGSWILMVLLLLLPINLLIFKTLIPNYMKTVTASSDPFSYREIGRFVVGNYFASLFWWSATDLLPLLVVELISSEANAYFYLSWTIAYSLYLISRNMGMSLITEGARDEKMLMIYSKKVLVQNGRIILLALLVILPLAQPILHLFGQIYAAEGAWVLRLLALSALPNIVTALYTSILRVQKRMKALLILNVAICILVLSISVTLMPAIGIIGGGIAWLISQLVVAIVLLLTELRSIWIPHLPTETLKPFIAIFQKGRRSLHQQKGKRILNEALLSLNSPQWVLKEVFPTVGDTIVGLVHNRDACETAVIKVTTSNAAKTSLQNHIHMLEALQKLDLPRNHMPLFPQANLIQDQKQLILIESKLPGIPLQEQLSEGSAQLLIQNACNALTPLHRTTAKELIIGEQILQEWLIKPCLSLLAQNDVEQDTVDLIYTYLLEQFNQKEIVTTWVHGDYCPSNILVLADLKRVTGILDWERSSVLGLPEFDYLHLWLTVQLSLQKIELGQLIINEFKHPSFDLGAFQMNKNISKRPLLILTWLWHIHSNLTKANNFSSNPIWVKNNISKVLSFLKEALPQNGSAT